MGFNRRSFLAQLAAVSGSAVVGLPGIARAATDSKSPWPDIIDSQVHANKFRAASVDPRLTLEAVVGAMDALGIKGVVIDEYTFRDKDGHMQPGGYDARGSWIPHRPFSNLAFERYPDRFRYLWRLDIQDPHITDLMGSLRKSQAGVAGLRLNTGPKRVVWSDPLFQNGGYAPYFELAEKHSLPVFLAIAPQAHTLAPYAKRFPGLKFIIDHIGLVSADERPDPNATPQERLRGLDRVAELAEFTNVSVKWAHIERLSTTPYPFNDVIAGLRRLVDVFGAQRVMWASDATETARPDRSPFPATWSQALHHVSDTALLSAEEKSWVLGRTARSVLNWPA